MKALSFSKGFWIAITLITIAVVALVLPNFNKARYPSAANGCVNMLRQIDSAANQFALENHKTNGEVINFPDDLTPYIKLNSQGKIPDVQAAARIPSKRLARRQPARSARTSHPPMFCSNKARNGIW